MDEARACTSELHRGARMPDDDREQAGHGMGGVRCRSWNVEDLQGPICYGCDIVDKTEVEVFTPLEKGPTV
eukprot:3650836-Heterocapsa_arctica.AAC.1